MSGSKFESKLKLFWENLPVFLKVLLVIGAAALGLSLAGGIFILIGVIVRALWNWLMPTIFALPSINFWQAWGLLVLSSILFRKGGSSSGSSSDRKRKRHLKENLRMEMDACSEETDEKPKNPE